MEVPVVHPKLDIWHLAPTQDKAESKHYWYWFGDYRGILEVLQLQEDRGTDPYHVTDIIDIQIMGPKTQEVSERTSALQITSPRSTLGPASLPPASALCFSSARRCPGAADSHKRRERDKNKDFVTRLRVNRDQEFRSNRNRARRNSKYCRETTTPRQKTTTLDCLPASASFIKAAGAAAHSAKVGH